MKRLRHIPLLLAAVPLLGGCATALPASEGLVFNQYYTASPDHPERETRLLHHQMVAFSASISPLQAEPVNQLAETRYEGNIRRTANPTQVSMSLHFVGSLGKRTVLSGYLGYPLGFDVTRALPRNWYLTLNWGMIAGGEVILQQPVLLRRGGGLSLGAFYRQDRYGIYLEDHISFFDAPDVRMKVHTLGMRGSGQLVNSSGGILRFVVSAGYAPTVHAPTFRLGLLFTGYRPHQTDTP